MIHKFYHCPNDGFTFQLIGYSAFDATQNVKKQMDVLKQEATTFAKLAGCKFDEVNTAYVDVSSHVRGNRLYFVKQSTPPEGATVLSNWQSMMRYVSN